MLARTLFSLSCMALAACTPVSGGDVPVAAPAGTLVGRLRLPDGTGPRGVEVTITTGDDGRVVWVLFDEQGRFAHALDGRLTGLTVTAGAEVYRIAAEDLSEADAAGQLDVGAIDLRDRLVQRCLTLRAARGAPGGEVRVGMWFGPPPRGPFGEPVSLGSRQFPPVALGSEVAWLLPNGAHSIYFLVERPAGPGRGTDWRSGEQRLFGPFTAAEFPAELVMD